MAAFFKLIKEDIKTTLYIKVIKRYYCRILPPHKHALRRNCTQVAKKKKTGRTNKKIKTKSIDIDRSLCIKWYIRAVAYFCSSRTCIWFRNTVFKSDEALAFFGCKVKLQTLQLTLKNGIMLFVLGIFLFCLMEH